MKNWLALMTHSRHPDFNDTCQNLYAKDMKPYHNWWHICRMVSYAMKNNIKYTDELACAVMAHDVIQNHHPDDVKDSVTFAEQSLGILGYTESFVEIVSAHIMLTDYATLKITPETDVRIILMDLGDFRDKKQREENEVNLMLEYGFAHKPGNFREHSKPLLIKIANTLNDCEGNPLADELKITAAAILEFVQDV